MNHLKMVYKFLEERRDFEDLPDLGFPFVTISRQAGAGGHLLSYVILTEFLKHKEASLFEGWHVFDKDLCEVVAKDPKLQGTMEILVAEKYRSEFRDFVESLFTGQSKQYMLYKTTFKVVRMLEAADKLEFEKAALLRDQIRELKRGAGMEVPKTSSLISYPKSRGQNFKFTRSGSQKKRKKA